MDEYQTHNEQLFKILIVTFTKYKNMYNNLILVDITIVCMKIK